MKDNIDWKRVSIDLRGNVLERFNEYMRGRNIKQTQACTELIEAGLDDLTRRGMNGFLLRLEEERPADNGEPNEGDIILAQCLGRIYRQNLSAYEALVLMIQSLLQAQEQSADYQAKAD